MNQFKEIFNDYKIIDYSEFNKNDKLNEANIAATLLKIQERKTAKGNSYCIIKLTDLNSVFELFIFSDILQLNREILIEGNSLIITLIKNISKDENRFKRINVKKIASLKNLFNNPLSEVTFEIKTSEEIKKISNLISVNGETIVNFKIVENGKDLLFRLKQKRNIDRKSINIIRNDNISAIIN